MHYFELWDTESRNLVETFDDRQAVAEALNEMSSLEGLALAQRDERGRTKWVDKGLVDLERVAREHARV